MFVFPSCKVVNVLVSFMTSFLISSRGNAYHYSDGTMFAQQAGAPYLDTSQAAQNFTAATTPGAVTSGQTFLQVTPAGTAMQAQRHPITHTTRASPATVSYPFLI